MEIYFGFLCLICWHVYLHGCIPLFRRFCDINRPSDMKLLFIFFLSTITLTLFEMAFYLITFILVGLYQRLVYCIEISASNDYDFTILSHGDAYGKWPKTIQFVF